jgi:hypothetical protein
MPVKTWAELMTAAEALRRAAWADDEPAAFRVAVDTLAQFLAGMSYGASLGAQESADYQERVTRWAALRPLLSVKPEDLNLVIEMCHGMIDRVEQMKLEREVPT